MIPTSSNRFASQFASSSRTKLPLVHPTSNRILPAVLPIPPATSKSQSPISSRPRTFHVSSIRSDFHFDTHHFVQRLEREGLNRAQAEGIMSAMAEVIDESVRNMTSNMVTKADQEKVRYLSVLCFVDLVVVVYLCQWSFFDDPCLTLIPRES